ncbi:hypothetical protein [Streptomyces sp. UG1]|uniref:hypothetical protein n=1 Tax=Streptomyces sp. UG1 TaxID=3417652 RepID=UPI003CF971E0
MRGGIFSAAASQCTYAPVRANSRSSARPLLVHSDPKDGQANRASGSTRRMIRAARSTISARVSRLPAYISGWLG